MGFTLRASRGAGLTSQQACRRMVGIILGVSEQANKGPCPGFGILVADPFN